MNILPKPPYQSLSKFRDCIYNKVYMLPIKQVKIKEWSNNPELKTKQVQPQIRDVEIL